MLHTHVTDPKKNVDAQTLFEILRVATKQNDTQPFVDYLKEIPKLSFFHLTYLVDIIIEKGSREHLLLFLFDAGFDFNAVPDVLDQLAGNAKRRNDTYTAVVLTLMALGIKWSSENTHISSFYTPYKKPPIPYLRYESKDAKVAGLRLKMHTHFHDASVSATWEFIHGLFLYASQNGLSNCVNALLNFKWPALILVENSVHGDRTIESIISLTDPKLLKTQPKTTETSTTESKQNLACSELAKTSLVSHPSSAFVPLSQGNNHRLDIPFITTFEKEAPSDADKKLEKMPVKPTFFIRKGQTIVIRPFVEFIDINFKNSYGETAYDLAKQNNHDVVLKCLEQKKEILHLDDHSSNSTDERKIGAQDKKN